MIIYNYFEYIDLLHLFHSSFYKFWDYESFLKLRVNLESRIVAYPFDVSLTRCDGTLRSSSIWNWLFSSLKQKAWLMRHSRMRAAVDAWGLNCLYRLQVSSKSSYSDFAVRFKLARMAVQCSGRGALLLGLAFEFPDGCQDFRTAIDSPNERPEIL